MQFGEGHQFDGKSMTASSSTNESLTRTGSPPSNTLQKPSSCSISSAAVWPVGYTKGRMTRVVLYELRA